MSSFLQKAAGMLGKAAGVLSNPLGTAGQLLAGAARPPMPNLPQISSGIGANVNVGGFTIGGEVGRRTTQSYFAQASGNMGGAGGAVPNCPRGYHPNKHALPASKKHGPVAARTICVRNRHVNALNGRAAHRALRRLKRADKMTRKIHSLFHHTRRLTAGKKR